MTMLLIEDDDSGGDGMVDGWCLVCVWWPMDAPHRSAIIHIDRCRTFRHGLKDEKRGRDSIVHHSQLKGGQSLLNSQSQLHRKSTTVPTHTQTPAHTPSKKQISFFLFHFSHSPLHQLIQPTMSLINRPNPVPHLQRLYQVQQTTLYSNTYTKLDTPTCWKTLL